MRSFVIALSSVIFPTALAFAQAAPTPPRPATPTNTAAPATGTGPSVNASGWMTEQKPGEWRASKLKGLNAYNGNDEKIGEIDEVLIDTTGKVGSVIIGVGGFLGMGVHQVAVPFNDLQFRKS